MAKKDYWNENSLASRLLTLLSFFSVAVPVFFFLVACLTSFGGMITEQPKPGLFALYYYGCFIFTAVMFACSRSLGEH